MHHQNPFEAKWLKDDMNNLKVILNKDFEEVMSLIPEVLKSEGFGVLTEIDMQATLLAKLGVTFPRYRILGACNPPLAHQALLADPHVGTMLPCNVVVRESGPQQTEVFTVDPVQTIGAEHRLRPLALAVRDKLDRVLTQLAARLEPA